MIRVDVSPNAPPSWRALRTAINEAIALSAVISCVFVDTRTMRGLNHRYRGINKPTNVLSFGWESESGDIIGDVILCRPVIRAEVSAKTYPDRLDHLFVHGVLHVLGYDHERASDARVMEMLEKKILGHDPYQMLNTKSEARSTKQTQKQKNLQISFNVLT